MHWLTYYFAGIVLQGFRDDYTWHRGSQYKWRHLVTCSRWCRDLVSDTP